MKANEFKMLDPLADVLDERCTRWFDSGELSDLKEAIRKVTASLPASYSVSIDVELRVYDENRDRVVRLLTAGVNAFPGQAPYRTLGDSSPQRYLVDGELCELPHDYCPHCWGTWDFKITHPTCPECGYSLGREVKLLLDSDICPHCEEGTVSLGNLTCQKCSFTVDPSFVAWG